MTHFSEFDLRRWQDAGPGEDRDRVVAHVAECPDCASRYASPIQHTALTHPHVHHVHTYASAGSAATCRL